MRGSTTSIVNPRLTDKSAATRPYVRNRPSPIHVQTVADYQRRNWRVTAVCLLLTVATISVYGTLISHPFLNYDDPQYVFENPNIQSGLSARTLTWALTAIYASNWHPLTWISHAIDYQLYGGEPAGHHISSLVIHLFNVLLLFWLLRRMTGATGRSAFVAGLFALHPLNVESVAWVAERKNVLSTLFFLLTVVAYISYLRRPNWKRYLILVLLFIMGLASKPMVITLPCVLLLLDYWPLCRIHGWTQTSTVFPTAQVSFLRLIREKLPLFALSLGSALVTVFAQKAGNSVEPLGYLPIGWRIENAIYSYAMYLAKVLWPTNLAVFYPHPLNSLTGAQISLSLLLLLTVSCFVWTQRTKRGYAVTGWLWFLGTLAPVIGIVQVGGQGMADRYAYIPTIGIFLILAWGCADVFDAASLNLRYGTGLALLILGVCSAITIHQLGYWGSSEDLWRHTLDVTQNNYIADDGMAYVLLHEGRHEALSYYQAAASIAPWDPISHNAVAGNLQDHGKIAEALQEYRIALSAKPQPNLSAHIYAELGIIYRALGDYEKAQQNSLLSLSTDPSELPNMISQLSKRVGEHPAAPGYYRLGSLLEGADRVAEARAAYETALQVNPEFSPAQRALEVLRTAQR